MGGVRHGAGWGKQEADGLHKEEKSTVTSEESGPYGEGGPLPLACGSRLQPRCLCIKCQERGSPSNREKTGVERGG